MISSIDMTFEAPPSRMMLDGDLIDGAEAIAVYLGWPKRKVYSAREKGWSVPIRKRDGVGIYAFKSELDAWLRAPETLTPRARALLEPKSFVDARG